MDFKLNSSYFRIRIKKMKVFLKENAIFNCKQRKNYENQTLYYEILQLLATRTLIHYYSHRLINKITIYILLITFCSVQSDLVLLKDEDKLQQNIQYQTTGRVACSKWTRNFSSYFYYVMGVTFETKVKFFFCFIIGKWYTKSDYHCTHTHISWMKIRMWKIKTKLNTQHTEHEKL